MEFTDLDKNISVTPIGQKLGLELVLQRMKKGGIGD